jgi:DnaJ-class molecular chaperone
MKDYFLNCHSEESIKIRFKMLSKEFHPDVNKDPGATEIMQEITSQRDQKLRDLYRQQGKSDQEIDELLTTIWNPDSMDKYTDMVANRILESGKKPTFVDIFKMVAGDLFAAEERKQQKKDLPGENRKEIGA